MPIATDKLTTLVEVKPNTFIFEKQQALDSTLCSDMIARFEQATDEQYKGRIGQQAGEDQGIKKTMDLVVSGKEHWKDVDHALFTSLKTALFEFREAFLFSRGRLKTWVTVCNVISPANIITGILMVVHMILVTDNLLLSGI